MDPAPLASTKSVVETIKDLTPLPATTQPLTDVHSNESRAQTLSDVPTASHQLAVASAQQPPEQATGAAQVEHELEVANLGWNEPQSQVPNPLVSHLHNEDLWVLVRRFNKQMYHLKEVEQAVPGGLDVNTAEDAEFSPDKLRSNLERLYMTMGIGLIALVKHVVRLRSWRETRRTAGFCLAYALAWWFDLIVPWFYALLVTLIVYPASRTALFPPAPVALVSAATGGVQKPMAGVLGSDDSATGAPENHKGEAVEAEATNFVNSIASVAISSASGQHPHGASDTAADQGGPGAAMASGDAAAPYMAAGKMITPKHDKTKVPMETALWAQMWPVMHAVADVSDTWERLGNALDPTPPFPNDVHRLRLAVLIVPLLALSLVTTSYQLLKAATFGMGFAFFGDPVIRRGLDFLDRKFPKWQKLLELRNTILKGVPTNAQLTITLLRIGEANRAPLPPPPRIDLPPPDVPAEVSDENLRATAGDGPLNATPQELDEAMAHDPVAPPRQTSGKDTDHAKGQKHGRTASKLLALFKGTAKGTVETAIGVDRLKAKAGSGAAKRRLGVVPPAGERPVSGPVAFKARFEGRRGHVYLATSRATGLPCVAFCADGNTEATGSAAGLEVEDLRPAWSVPVGAIRELKKHGGYGWKAKLVVGWALDRQVNDGLEIVDRGGTAWLVTAVPLRDEMFNRLCAMGGQKWEAR